MEKPQDKVDEILALILAEGEGQKVEFKRGIANLAPEMVAFANAGGGSIFVGVDDAGVIAGIPVSNKLRSEIQNSAANCDPPIAIHLKKHGDYVLEVAVPDGKDKPYRCKEGFFLRNGPNSQKLRRNEIRDLILLAGSFHYDEMLNAECVYPGDFDENKLRDFLKLAGVDTTARLEDVLLNIDAAKKQGPALKLTNAGVLFFAHEPQKFLKESYCTCVRYQGADRFSIVDRQDIFGGPIAIIEESLKFVRRNIAVAMSVGSGARHEELFDYPMVAVREAIINAVMHRDYYFDGSHIYIHLYSDRLEIDSPGGLAGGLTMDDLGRRSVRRNRLIADLLFRARYIERIGSGIERMKRVLAENKNPMFEISATNFFAIRFFPRIKSNLPIALSERQSRLLIFIRERKTIARHDAAAALGVSEDTILRELDHLQKSGLIERTGTGKATRYGIK